MLNRTCLPSDIIAFVVFCRQHYRPTLRDRETELLPIIGKELRKRRHGA